MKDYQFLIITGILLNIQSNGETDKTMIAMTGSIGLILITIGILNSTTKENGK